MRKENIKRRKDIEDIIKGGIKIDIWNISKDREYIEMEMKGNSGKRYNIIADIYIIEDMGKENRRL